MADNKKTLLEEGTIRRFMKLAELGPLAGNFLNNIEEDVAEEESTVFTEDEDDVSEEELDVLDLGGEDEEVDAVVDLEEPVGDSTGELTLTDEEAEAILVVADKIRAAMDLTPDPEEVEVDMDVEDEDPDFDMDVEGGDLDLDMGVEDELDIEEGIEETTKKGEKITTGSTKDEEAYEYPSKGEKSVTRKGEEDYTTKKGMKKKTGPGKAYMQESPAANTMVNEIARRVLKRILTKNK